MSGTALLFPSVCLHGMGGEAEKTLHLSACNSNYAELNDSQ